MELLASAAAIYFKDDEIMSIKTADNRRVKLALYGNDLALARKVHTGRGNMDDMEKLHPPSQPATSEELHR